MPYGQCAVDMLVEAEANISTHFSVVGFTERFDETLILFKRSFGWRVDGYSRRNVGKNRPATEQVPIDTLRLLEDLNQLDIQLYENAVTRFDTAIKRMGAQFSIDLRRLQWTNTLRNYYGPVLRRFGMR